MAFEELSLKKLLDKINNLTNTTINGKEGNITITGDGSTINVENSGNAVTISSTGSGTVDSAKKLSGEAANVGSISQPVYFSNGIPVVANNITGDEGKTKLRKWNRNKSYRFIFQEENTGGTITNELYINSTGLRINPVKGYIWGSPMRIKDYYMSSHNFWVATEKYNQNGTLNTSASFLSCFDGGGHTDQQDLTKNRTMEIGARTYNENYSDAQDSPWLSKITVRPFAISGKNSSRPQITIHSSNIKLNASNKLEFVSPGEKGVTFTSNRINFQGNYNSQTQKYGSCSIQGHGKTSLNDFTTISANNGIFNDKLSTTKLEIKHKENGTTISNYIDFKIINNNDNKYGFNFETVINVPSLTINSNPLIKFSEIFEDTISANQSKTVSNPPNLPAFFNDGTTNYSYFLDVLNATYPDPDLGTQQTAVKGYLLSDRRVLLEMHQTHNYKTTITYRIVKVHKTNYY